MAAQLLIFLPFKIMEINKKRYNDIDSYFKRKFNKKIIKLPLDGGFTCPNRDGRLSYDGCIFCSDRASGEFTVNNFSINQQISYQKKRLSKKGRDQAYIAYFQNFTNTYASVEKLKFLYNQALSSKDIVGLSIATRADCLNDEIYELLKEINKKTFLYIELGMQSVNEKTIEFINRSYKHEVLDKAVLKLNDLNIKVLLHIIVGFPNETIDDYLKDIAYVNKRKIWGIKIHKLFIEEDSKIKDHYLKNKEKYIMSLTEYCNYVIMMLENLNKTTTIHRLTGDGIKDKIIEPLWSKNKASVLSSIDKIMKDKNIRQGDLWKEK